MPVFISTIINSKHYQINLLDARNETIDNHSYKKLEEADENFSGIEQELRTKNLEELLVSIKAGVIYYQIKPVSHFFVPYEITDPSLSELVEPFWVNGGRPNPHFLTLKVSAHLYYQTEDDRKIEFFDEFRKGHLFFDVVTNKKQIPERAIPLLELPDSEIKAFVNAYNRYRWKLLFWDFIDNIKNVSLGSIGQFFWVGLITVSLFRLAGASSAKNQFTQESLITDLDLFTPPITGTMQASIEPVLIETLGKVQTQKQPFPTYKSQSEKTFLSLTAKQKTSYFYSALKDDNLKHFRVALDNGIDLFMKNANGEFLFAHTAHFNSRKIIKFVALSLKIDLNLFHDDNRFSLLSYCLINNNDELARDLIDWGVNPNQLDASKLSALHLLSSSTPEHERLSLQIIKKLVGLGADINLVSPANGHSPIFFAAQHNNIKIVQFFLNKNCNLINKNKIHLINFCAIACSYQMNEHLLKSGLDPNYGMEQGMFNVVPDSPLVYIAKERQNLELIRLYIKYKARIDHPLLSAYLLGAAYLKKDQDFALELVKNGVTIEFFKKSWGKEKRKTDPVLAKSIANFVKPLEQFLQEEKARELKYNKATKARNNKDVRPKQEVTIQSDSDNSSENFMKSALISVLELLFVLLGLRLISDQIHALLESSKKEKAVDQIAHSKIKKSSLVVKKQDPNSSLLKSAILELFNIPQETINFDTVFSLSKKSMYQKMKCHESNDSSLDFFTVQNPQFAFESFFFLLEKYYGNSNVVMHMDEIHILSIESLAKTKKINLLQEVSKIKTSLFNVSPEYTSIHINNCFNLIKQINLFSKEECTNMQQSCLFWLNNYREIEIISGQRERNSMLVRINENIRTLLFSAKTINYQTLSIEEWGKQLAAAKLGLEQLQLNLNSCDYKVYKSQIEAIMKDHNELKRLYLDAQKLQNSIDGGMEMAKFKTNPKPSITEIKTDKSGKSQKEPVVSVKNSKKTQHLIINSELKKPSKTSVIIELKESLKPGNMPGDSGNQCSLVFPKECIKQPGVIPIEVKEREYSISCSHQVNKLPVKNEGPIFSAYGLTFFAKDLLIDGESEREDSSLFVDEMFKNYR